MLSDTELKQITEEAERLYPGSLLDGILIGADLNKPVRYGYIAAATAGREREKILVEALRQMIGQFSMMAKTLGEKRTVLESKQALDNYSKSINNGK